MFESKSCGTSGWCRRARDTIKKVPSDYAACAGLQQASVECVLLGWHILTTIRHSVIIQKKKKKRLEVFILGANTRAVTTERTHQQYLDLHCLGSGIG